MSQSITVKNERYADFSLNLNGDGKEANESGDDYYE